MDFKWLVIVVRFMYVGYRVFLLLQRGCNFVMLVSFA